MYCSSRLKRPASNPFIVCQSLTCTVLKVAQTRIWYLCAASCCCMSVADSLQASGLSGDADNVDCRLQDILVSLDDKYLYFSNWIRGCAVVASPMVPKILPAPCMQPD